MGKILSVIIPSYNAEKYLDKCISSLITDCISKTEIIVVNDGSTDGTEKKATGYAEKYPDSIKIINKQNGGHGSAINVGAKAACGKYMKVLDADDWFLSENIPEYIANLEKINSDVVLTCHHTIDVGTGEIRNWRCFPEQFNHEYTMEEVMKSWKSFDRSLTFHGITYRTDFYKEQCIELIENVFYEDHEYATFPCLNAKSITCLDLFVYEYRIGDISQSVSAENQLKRLSHTEAVLKDMTRHGKEILNPDANMYREKKTHLLLLSYLVTALLCDKNRRRGRQTAQKIMEWYSENDNAVYNMSINHYKILRTLNYAHIGLKGYNKILRSKLYNKIRHNKSFD